MDSNKTLLYISQQNVVRFLDVVESKNYLICTFWVYVIDASTVRLPFGASLIIQFLSGTSPPPRKERERDRMFLTCDDTTLSSPTRQLLDKCSQNSPRYRTSRSDDPLAFPQLCFDPRISQPPYFFVIMHFIASHKSFTCDLHCRFTL